MREKMAVDRSGSKAFQLRFPGESARKARRRIKKAAHRTARRNAKAFLRNGEEPGAFRRASGRDVI